MAALADDDDDSCTGDFFNIDAVIDDVAGTNQARICQLEGQRAQITITVEDLATGATVSASQGVLHTDPDDDCP